jgi:hypothetical protein
MERRIAMAHPHLSTTLARFEARVQKSKNRLVAIPSEVQRAVGLERRKNNHILLISFRSAGRGRWNKHYVKLTYDNEFAIPTDVARIKERDRLDVKIHRLIADGEPGPRVGPATGAGLLLALAESSRPGWRKDGSTRVDEYLKEDIDRD